ncbi:MAG: LamG-like jellyroll fold domain-containing protein, partial [Bacteroidota bacterium]|nr:LamG-like jellyroll fold domain-containing protein [Bacteroidota bacterium]
CTANAGSDQTICIGGTALITASAGDTYKWSTGGTTPAITVNPTATSTYTVTITKGNCTASDNVVVYVSGSVPTLGQSSYFSFNGNANDAVGGLNGTVNGATLTTDRFGKSNSAYLFNGTNNFIAIPGTYDFEPRTINVWFNPSDGDYSDRRYVFVSDNPNLIKGHVELYILDINGVKKLINWTDDAEDTVDIVLNKWYNATITVDNNKLVKFYLNGCLINASYYNSNIHSVNGLENFIIGSARTSLSRFFLGKIDEVRIYNRTLTDCEIKNLYDLPILSNVNAGPDQTICKGNSTTLTATGGTNYAWSTGASTSTISVSPSVTTTYTITSKDGCNSATDAVVITVNNPPLVNAGPDQTICKGASTTLSATGGTTYSWSNGGITAAINVNPTTTTTYTVTATSDSCTATDNIVIFINDSASTNGLVSFFPFKGNANDTKGTYNGTVSGATLTTDRFGNSNSAYLFNGINNYISIPNTYDFIPRTINIWFNASDGDYSDLRVIYGSDNPNLKNGLVYATIKDINGAKKLLLSVADTRDTVDISLNKWYNITISTDINKMVKFYLNGCLISILYYNTNLTSVDGLNNSIIGAGRFAANRFFLGKIDDIKIFNRVLCESEIKYLYDLPVNSSVNAGPDQTICKGASTTLTATGGTTYIWGNGSTTSTISVSPSITTTYTVTSKDGCNSATDAVVITVNTINANAGNDITIGKGNSATLTATGGSTYKWSNGGTSASILVSPTINSTYIVTVANNFGCSATDNVVVSVIELCTANAGNDVTTCTNNDARLIASGGDSYKWSNGGTTAMISVSPSITSTYTVTITKGTCTASDNVVVSVIPGIQVNAGNDMTVCNGAQTTLTATGGTTYLWSNGGTTSSISIKPNSTSTYSVTATLGICSATDIVIVTIQNPPHANAGNDITIGKGNQTTLTATGGSTYKWSNGETSASIVVSPTINSTYIVTVTDNFGCSATDNVIVSVVELCTANAGNDVTTCTNNDARLIASGGDSYKWSNGAATAMISVSPSVTTTYTVTITKGTCTASDNVVVSVIPGINVYAGNNVVVCNGAQTTLTATGGTSYLWSNGATTQSIIIKPTSSTTYFVTATSGICSATNSVTVTTGSVTANAGNDVTICKENDTRLIATGAESYKWSNGGTTAMISVRPTITTTYTLTATTGYCTATDIVVVMVNNLNINAGPDLTICAGNSTTLNVPGADSYVWNDGYYTANRTVTPSVTTTYTVTGKTGVCTASDAVVINVNPMPALTTGPDRTINSGTSIILTASGATIYTWNTGANTGSVNVSPTITTTYKVTGSNNGCSVVKSIVVNVLSSPSANAGSDITICLLDTPRLTATGGAFYKWSTGSRNQSIIVNPTTTTTYTLTATSKNGATSSDQIVVTVVSTNANAGVDRVICYGSSTTLTATGGEKYKWNTGATTQSITVNPLALKCYAVTASVSAIKECSSSDIVVVRVIRAIANAGPDVTICKGNNVNLNSTGGQYYKWNTGATTSVMTVLPSVTTNYTVTISNALGCTASDAILVSIIKCKNIDNIPENFANVSYEDIFNVYPNPFNQSTTLTYSLNKPSNIEINLFDILGNKVETITNERKSEGSYVKNIDREKLVSGIYFVEFKTEDLRILKKIVIL